MAWSLTPFHRFVDRDMIMCYHYGLGVRHVYAHRSPFAERPAVEKWDERETEPPEQLEDGGEDPENGYGSEGSLNSMDHALRSDSDMDECPSDVGAESDDAEFEAMDEMYRICTVA